MTASAQSESALMAGYLQSWSNLSLTAAAEAGYTGLILAFGSIDGTKVEIFENSFPPDNGDDGQVDAELLRQDIAGAIAKGASEVLVSFGGGNNTFSPGSASASDLGAAIVTFLQTYGFTGCDFDIEIEVSGSYLKDLISAIKTGDSSLTVTAAPQLNQVGSAVAYVTTAVDTAYDEALEANLFDYLFVQAYNTCSFEISGQTEEDVAFVSAAFDYLTGITPQGTRICLGQPASANGAGACSVYNGPNAGSQIYDDLAQQYQSLAAKAQFGGAMVWDINLDQDNGYPFVNAMGPAVQGNS